jgi:hypothetical protein
MAHAHGNAQAFCLSEIRQNAWVVVAPALLAKPRFDAPPSPSHPGKTRWTNRRVLPFRAQAVARLRDKAAVKARGKDALRDDVAAAKAALSASQRAAAALDAKCGQLAREKARNLATRARDGDAFALLAAYALYGLAVRPAFDPCPAIAKAAGAVKKLSDEEEKALRALEVQNTVRQKKENEAAAAAEAEAEVQGRARGGTGSNGSQRQCGSGQSQGDSSSSSSGDGGGAPGVRSRLSFVSGLEGALQRHSPRPHGGARDHTAAAAANAAAVAAGDAASARSSNGAGSGSSGSGGDGWGEVKGGGRAGSGGRVGPLDALFDPDTTDATLDPLSPPEPFSPGRSSQGSSQGSVGRSSKGGGNGAPRARIGLLGGRIRNFMSSAANSSEQEKMCEQNSFSICILRPPPLPLSPSRK